ncbi:MAG TPA: CPBP family glutamic-type intramembrane protease [Gemmatimonadaceae bacterium]|nr:CPBP family glutamic-type intramembrane protease [Gemmatimonadaceae bacterium]
MLDSAPDPPVRLRGEIAAFYVTCLAISWAGMLRWHLPPGYRMGDLTAVRAAFDDVGVVMVLGPIAAAVLTTLFFRGGRAVLALVRRAVAWRVAPRWYAAALLAPVIPQWLALGAWQAATGAELQPIDLSHAVSAWAYTTVLGALILAGEEVGWRGFLLPRVQQRVRPLAAALLVGLLWALWHFPAWFVANRAATGSASRTLQIVALSTVGTLALSVIVTWIFNAARGSILLAMLFHGSQNASMNLIYDVIGPREVLAARYLAASTLAVTLLAAVIALGNWRRQRPSQYLSSFTSTSSDIASGPRFSL